MSARRQSALWSVCISAVLAAAVLAGCSKESTNEPPAAKAPALPPAESMQLDLSTFAPEGLGKAPESLTKFNFWNAQLRAAFFNILVAAVVAPPAAAINGAVHSVPSPQSDGSWIWTYTIVDGDRELVLRLRGIATDEGAFWQMFVTAEFENPPLVRALWFEGETHGEDDGEWTLYDVSREGHPAVLHIDWEVTTENDRVLSFEVIDPSNEAHHDTLVYSDVDATASIVYHDFSEDATIEIVWDQGTGSGSLIAPDYRGGERSCWDEQQNDVVCAS